jgi:signal transduction histidine kinase
LQALREGDCVRLNVCDRGEGVPEDFVDRLFDRFSQGPNTDGASSTGLGLSIVRGLAEAQGGSAWYEPRPGGGSCFAVTLPATAALSADVA